MSSRVLHLCIKLGLADLVKDGAKTADELARTTSTHAPSLARLLRALVALGALDEVEAGSFRLAAGAESLCSGVPGSVLKQAVLFGSDEIWESWGQLEHCIRTGESGYKKAYGMSPFDHRAQQPELARGFNEAMAAMTHAVMSSLMAVYDFTKFAKVVDLGGGNGALLSILLGAAPAQRGVVFDIPSGAKEAPATLAAAGLTDRCEIVEGSFFDSVPSGADAYVLKQILLDWADDDVVSILRTIRKGMSDSARLIILEPLLPGAASPATRLPFMLDLNMLAGPGGQWRTDAQLRALLGKAGFEVTTAVDSALYLIEAKPV